MAQPRRPGIVLRMDEDHVPQQPERAPEGRSRDPAGGRPQVTSPLTGLAAGALLLAVVALPASWAGAAAFLGCFKGCSALQALGWSLWAGVALLLLALPVAVGVATARARRPDIWFLATLAVAAVAFGYYAAGNPGWP